MPQGVCRFVLEGKVADRVGGFGSRTDGCLRGSHGCHYGSSAGLGRNHIPSAYVGIIAAVEFASVDVERYAVLLTSLNIELIDFVFAKNAEE